MRRGDGAAGRIVGLGGPTGVVAWFSVATPLLVLLGAFTKFLYRTPLCRADGLLSGSTRSRLRRRPLPDRESVTRSSSSPPSARSRRRGRGSARGMCADLPRYRGGLRNPSPLLGGKIGS